jgi:hypothetical protein
MLSEPFADITYRTKASVRPDGTFAGIYEDPEVVSAYLPNFNMLLRSSDEPMFFTNPSDPTMGHSDFSFPASANVLNAIPSPVLWTFIILEAVGILTVAIDFPPRESVTSNLAV